MCLYRILLLLATMTSQQVQVSIPSAPIVSVESKTPLGSSSSSLLSSSSSSMSSSLSSSSSSSSSKTPPVITQNVPSVSLVDDAHQKRVLGEDVLNLRKQASIEYFARGEQTFVSYHGGVHAKSVYALLSFEVKLKWCAFASKMLEKDTSMIDAIKDIILSATHHSNLSSSSSSAVMHILNLDTLIRDATIKQCWSKQVELDMLPTREQELQGLQTWKNKVDAATTTTTTTITTPTTTSVKVHHNTVSGKNIISFLIISWLVCILLQNIVEFSQLVYQYPIFGWIYLICLIPLFGIFHVYCYLHENNSQSPQPSPQPPITPSVLHC